MERNDFLINKKIRQYILPGILMTVAMQLGNVVDGMIVGNILGPDAMAAIELSMPIVMLLQMPAMMLAMGGSAAASVLLGKRETEKAGQVFTAALASGLVVSFLFVLLTGILPRPLSLLLAGNEVLAALIEPYIMVNFAGIPVLTAAIVLCYFMNVDNHPQLGSALFVIANVVNLVLDIVFLQVFHWGMMGSALSTVIGYLTGLVTVFFYWRSEHRMLRLARANGDGFLHLKSAATAGIPSAAFTLMSALKSVILNSAIVRLLGNDSMAVYSVCINAVLIAELFVGGIIGLIPSIAGILYGERDYFGVRALCRRVLKYSYAMIALLVLGFFAFPQGIAGLFGIWEGDILELANVALRIFALSFPFYVFNKFLMSYYQTILQPGLSTTVTVLQGFLVIVPLTLIGLALGGLPGVCIAAVLSEGLTAVIAKIYTRVRQKQGKLPAGDHYLLPEVRETACFDYSILSEIRDVVKLRNCLLAFCEQHKIATEHAKVMGLALEEIAVNIVQYGYRSDQKNYIDINFTIQDGIYILRIRDDGIPFDPLSYEPECDEDVPVGGIALLKKMTSNFQYMRVLNMNNTVIELNMNRS